MESPFNWNSPFLFKGLFGGIFFTCIQLLIEHSVSKQWRSDQTPRSVAPGLGLHYLPMFSKKDARLIWVKKSVVLLQTFL